MIRISTVESRIRRASGLALDLLRARPTLWLIVVQSQVGRRTSIFFWPSIRAGLRRKTQGQRGMQRVVTQLSRPSRSVLLPAHLQAVTASRPLLLSSCGWPAHTHRGAPVVGVQWCSVPRLFLPLIKHPAARDMVEMSMNPAMRWKLSLLRNWRKLHVITPLATHNPLVGVHSAAG